MEKRYGIPLEKLRIFPFIFSSQFIVGVGLLIAGICVLALSSGVVRFAVSIPLIIVAIAFVFAASYQITQCGVYLYDKLIVVKGLFKTQEFPIDDILAIYWDFPGKSSINPRGPRKNCTTADIILKNGKTGYHLSDAYYANLEAKLSLYQNERKISRSLEKGRK